MYNTAYHTKDPADFSFLITAAAGFIGSNLAECLLRYKVGTRDYEACRATAQGLDFVHHRTAPGSVTCSIRDPQTTSEVTGRVIFGIAWAIFQKHCKDWLPDCIWRERRIELALAALL